MVEEKATETVTEKAVDKEFILIEKKGRLLDILSTMGVMSGGKDPIITPIVLRVSEDKKSLGFEYADKTSTVLVTGKWTPMTLQSVDIPEIIMDPAIVYEAINTMDDDMVTMKITTTQLIIETNRTRAWMGVQDKKSESPPTIPKFKKFMATAEVDAPELKSIIARAMKYHDPKKLIVKIDGQVLYIETAKVGGGSMGWSGSVTGMVKALGEEADDITSGFSSQLLSNLFGITTGKIVLTLGKAYPLKVELSDPSFSITYIISPMLDQ